MATLASNVNVGVTGAIYGGPTGSTAPTNATTAPNAAFTDLGYVTEDGVTESQGLSTNKIRAWQNGDIVRTVQTEHDLTYSLSFLETNDDVLAAFYNDYAAGAVHITGEEGTRQAWIIDVLDGLDKIRTYIPDGQITEKGDVQYVNGDAISYPVVITAYPDSSGVKAYKWFSGTGS